MVDTSPEVFDIRVHATCPSHARTDLVARHHELVIDEPPERDGTDLAPTPLETLLASFLGCTNVVANMIAAEMGIRIDTMTLDLVAKLDRRGILDRAEVPVPFPVIALNVDIVTDATEAQIDALKTALARRCPISLILRRAGTRIDETWTIVRP